MGRGVSMGTRVADGVTLAVGIVLLLVAVGMVVLMVVGQMVIAVATLAVSVGLALIALAVSIVTGVGAGIAVALMTAYAGIVRGFGFLMPANSPARVRLLLRSTRARTWARRVMTSYTLPAPAPAARKGT